MKPSPTMQKALEEKERTRKRLCDLPFKKKYNMLVRIQKRSAANLASKGIKRRVWPEWDSKEPNTTRPQ